MLNSLKQKALLIMTVVFMCAMMLAMPIANASDFALDDFATKYGVWIGLIFVIVEYVLGKTTLVKSGSTLELVLNTVIGLLKKVFGPKSTLKLK